MDYEPRAVDKIALVYGTHITRNDPQLFDMRRRCEPTPTCPPSFDFCALVYASTQPPFFYHETHNQEQRRT
jgi:hypothetical protein